MTSFFLNNLYTIIYRYYHPIPDKKYNYRKMRYNNTIPTIKPLYSKMVFYKN